MTRYLASDVYEKLEFEKCELTGKFDGGTGWITSGLPQSFMLPDPHSLCGKKWFYAEALDDMFANRWLGFRLGGLRRYSDFEVNASFPKAASVGMPRLDG